MLSIGDNYFEVDVDVGSDYTAAATVSKAIRLSKELVVDMGICLEGREEAELPEVMIGACTCVRLDTTLAQPLEPLK